MHSLQITCMMSQLTEACTELTPLNATSDCRVILSCILIGYSVHLWTTNSFNASFDTKLAPLFTNRQKGNLSLLMPFIANYLCHELTNRSLGQTCHPWMLHAIVGTFLSTYPHHTPPNDKANDVPEVLDIIHLRFIYLFNSVAHSK